MNKHKRIWLIKESEEDSYWCDCPDPSNEIEEEDITEYLRINIHNEKIANLQYEIVTKWEHTRLWREIAGERQTEVNILQANNNELVEMLKRILRVGPVYKRELRGLIEKNRRVT